MLPFPRAAVDAPLAARWRDVVADAAARTAVDAPAGALTYARLDERARALAAVLATGPAGEPVAVLVREPAAVAVAAVGVLLSGRPLLALDAATPPARLAGVVEAAGATTCVVDAAGAPVAAALHLDAVGVDQPAAPAGAPLPEPAPDAPATLVFTSGTTGRPQGVVCSQRVTLHDAWLRADAGWCRPDDSVALLLPAAFGLGLAELLSGLLTGAAVHVHDPRDAGPAGLLRALSAHRTTVLAATPSLLRALLDVPGAGPGGPLALPAGLRLVRSGGERFSSTDARAVVAALPPGCRLLNVLGSSETALLTSWEVDVDALGDAPALPAGHPVADRELAVELPDGSPAAPGEPGELVVVSRLLPSGYWRDPVRTAQRFEDLGDGRVRVRTRDRARLRPDGCVELLGRLDQVVKVRGTRVEPAEVEAVLLTHPDVAEAVVSGESGQGPGRRGRDRLVAHVVPRRGTRPSPAQLRAHVRGQLPAAMCPDVVDLLAALPRTERGKVDRAALPPASSTPWVAPVSERERVLAELWGFVLELTDVGRDDDFFELGGDSLDLQHLLTRLADDHGVRAVAADVLAAPTPALFAERCRRGAAPGRRSGPLVPSSAAHPPLFCIAGAGGLAVSFLPLARRLAPTCAVHALQAHRLETGGLPDWTLARAARRHLAQVRRVQPRGPYHLAGHSLGALLALEVAAALRAAGEEVALLVLVDSFAPGRTPAPAPRTALRRVRDAVSVALTGLLPVPGQGHTPRFYNQGVLLGRRYRGRTWEGRALVVVAADEPGDRALGWERWLSGPWQLREVPGTHLSVLREPSVAALAGVIADALEDVRTPRPRTVAGRPTEEEAVRG
ncbi:alpha/beta fold hydrolase [Kineococcus gypseus]|uniref:alpha/beta fold hydrolase n=1 Tax=Kineococcus gypseus TaxID=1637102 RepID=UPI003D7DD201